MRQPHSFYPVRGVAPSLCERGCFYLHVVTSFPSGPPTWVAFAAYKSVRIQPGSTVHSKAYIPSVGGYPLNGTILLDSELSLEDREVWALGEFARENEIEYSRGKGFSGLEVGRASLSVVLNQPEILVFDNVPSEAIMLAGLRAFAEQRQLR